MPPIVLLTAAVAVFVAFGEAAQGGTHIHDFLQTMGAIGDPVADAQQVLACEKAHEMTRAHETMKHSKKTLVYRSCEWPRPDTAEADGYPELRQRAAEGPNTTSEWPIGPYAMRITSDTCKSYTVWVSASGGTFKTYPQEPFTLRANEVRTAENKVWHDSSDVSQLPFLRQRDEAVLLTNDHYGIDRIACAS